MSSCHLRCRDHATFQACKNTRGRDVHDGEREETGSARQVEPAPKRISQEMITGCGEPRHRLTGHTAIVRSRTSSTPHRTFVPGAQEPR